ncbi:MAG: flagellar protein FlaG [Candidatus Accumulibacter sp.]|jgi:flagellar protein FlaG|uniref:flagellar protein FlaG n=1 Tax=Accumulibacter sp. TaxID=2053492 RepID=UPI001A52FFA5|nr:flagellar protein FlaG [Accumulibacter sp.]MBL8395768.1 flagellar protein FlaG [Accumulibacter sp.]
MNIQPTTVSLPPHAQPVANPVAREARTPAESTTRATEQALSRQQVQAPAREQLEAATESVRAFVQPINSNLEFSVDDDTGQLVVRIIDRTTKEVIRQMPSAEMLAIAKALDSIKGLFVKQSA